MIPKLKSLKMVYHTASGFEVKFKGYSVTRIFVANYSVVGRNPFVTTILDEDFENQQRIEINGDGTVVSNHSSAASHKEILDKLVAHIKNTFGW